MCLLPAPPKIPKPTPPPSKPEETADRVVVGSKRKVSDSGVSSRSLRRRLGTRSLQIPLGRTNSTSNLNY